MQWQLEASPHAAGVAVLVYGLVGVFGAARFGRDTAGDILVNTWLGGRAEGFLDLAVTAYLAISMPPVQVLPHVVRNHHAFLFNGTKVTRQGSALRSPAHVLRRFINLSLLA